MVLWGPSFMFCLGPPKVLRRLWLRMVNGNFENMKADSLFTDDQLTGVAWSLKYTLDKTQDDI